MKDYRTLSLLWTTKYFVTKRKTKPNNKCAYTPSNKKLVTMLAYPPHHILVILSVSCKFTCLTLLPKYCVIVCWYAFINNKYINLFFSFFLFFKPNDSGCACYGYLCTSLARRSPNQSPSPPVQLFPHCSDVPFAFYKK